MNVKRINVSFAKEAIQENDLFNYFAVAIMVKDLFRSSCVHNYTKNGLASKLGTSATTIAKAVKIGLKMGFCRIDGTSLIFLKIGNKGNKTIKISKFGEIPKTFKEVKYFIKAMMVVDKLRVMNYWRHSNLSKRKQKCNRNGQKSNVAVISYNGLSKMLNCSNPTAIKVVKFATKHKIIRKKVSKARIGISKSGQGQFFAYGKILSQPVNQYLILGKAA